MASQLEFEGPVLEEVLERVRAEVGPGARIVAANRVRKGGVAGFFARQAFEVLVEAPDPAAPELQAPPHATAPSTGPDPRVATTILELAELVSEHERNDVIDLIDDRRVSTESRDFAQVLDRFSRSIDAGPDELAGERPLGPHEPPDRRAGGPDTTPGALGDPGEIDLRESDGRDSDYAVGGRPGFASAPLPLPTEPSEPAPRTFDDDIGIVVNEAAPARRSVQHAGVPPEIIDRYETRLSRMGLPARLIPRGVGQHELKGALVEALAQLPAAPRIPSALGAVIAVTGIGAAPVHLARELAAELALDPDDIVLATRDELGGGIPAWLQMSDAETAQERRRSWRRRTRPTIVACSLSSVSSLRWAREMLDNLEPTITWAIVDAGWKRDDLAHRIDALGGIDVLALDRIDDTVSPAAVLELGIPVGRLEHEHASPLTWAELLLERLQ